MDTEKSHGRSEFFKSEMKREKEEEEEDDGEEEAHGHSLKWSKETFTWRHEMEVIFKL